MSQLDKLIDAMLERSKGKISVENLDLFLIEGLILIRAEIDLLKEEVRKLNE